MEPNRRSTLVTVVTTLVIAGVVAGCTTVRQGTAQAKSDLLPTGATSTGEMSATPGGDSTTPTGTATSSAEQVIEGPAVGVAEPRPTGDAALDNAQRAGFDLGTATFLAATTATLTVIDGHTFVVDQRYGNGQTGQLSIHLFSDDADLADEPVLHAAVTEQSADFTLIYRIATDSWPADLKAQILAGIPAAPPAGLGLGLRGSPAAIGGIRPRAADGSSVGVVVSGTIKAAGEYVIDEALDKAGDAGLSKTSWEAYKAGKAIVDAIEANDRIVKLLDRIKAARKCVQKPTNPLTQQHYQDNPGAQQADIDFVDQMHSEAMQNAVVTFGAMAVSAGTGLVKQAPWLGIVVGPAVDWTLDTLAKTLDKYAEAAEQRAVECRGFIVSGNDDGAQLNGPIGPITKPFSVRATGAGFTATYVFTPDNANGKSGSVAYTGTSAVGQLTGAGSYTISGADPGPYKLKMQVRGCVESDAGSFCAGGSLTTLTVTPIPEG